MDQFVQWRKVALAVLVNITYLIHTITTNFGSLAIKVFFWNDMKIANLRLFACAMGICLLVNCTKDEKVETNAFLLIKTWKRATSDKNVGSNPTGRILYQTIAPCDADDLYNFKSDGILEIDKGIEKCEVSEPKIEKGTYHTAAKTITIKGVTYTLAEASEKQVKYYVAISANTGYDNVVILLQ